jgi:HEAT repeat protein
MIGHTLGRVACAVYWFHPLAWTAARKLRDASERACDDLALRLGARPSEYAQHLLDIVTSVRQTDTPTAAIAMARRKEFEGRMLAILDPALRRETASRWRTVALSGTLAMFVLAVSAAAPAQRAAVADTPVHTAQSADPGAGSDTSTDDPSAGLPETAMRDASESQEGPLPVATRGEREATPVIDRFLRDQARRLNVDVNTFLAGEAADPEKRDLLVRLLRTDSASTVRRVAAWGLLPYVADANAQSALVTALQGDNDPAVRKMSAWALGHSPAAAALGALRNAYRSDRDDEVREMAVWGIGNHGDASDAALISDRLASESSSDVRGTSAWALGNIGAPRAPRALIAMLEDTDGSTRLRAAWALSQIGDSTALPAIQRALSVSQEESTTRALLRALVQSGASSDALAGLINSPNADVRLAAIRSMTGGGLVDPWPWPWPRPIVWP